MVNSYYGVLHLPSKVTQTAHVTLIHGLLACQILALQRNNVLRRSSLYNDNGPLTYLPVTLGYPCLPLQALFVGPLNSLKPATVGNHEAPQTQHRPSS